MFFNNLRTSALNVLNAFININRLVLDVTCYFLFAQTNRKNKSLAGKKEIYQSIKKDLKTRLYTQNTTSDQVALTNIRRETNYFSP